MPVQPPKHKSRRQAQERPGPSFLDAANYIMNHTHKHDKAAQATEVFGMKDDPGYIAKCLEMWHLTDGQVSPLDILVGDDPAVQMLRAYHYAGIDRSIAGWVVSDCFGFLRSRPPRANDPPKPQHEPGQTQSGAGPSDSSASDNFFAGSQWVPSQIVDSRPIKVTYALRKACNIFYSTLSEVIKMRVVQLVLATLDDHSLPPGAFIVTKAQMSQEVKVGDIIARPYNPHDNSPTCTGCTCATCSKWDKIGEASEIGDKYQYQRPASYQNLSHDDIVYYAVTKRDEKSGLVYNFVSGEPNWISLPDYVIVNVARFAAFWTAVMLKDETSGKSLMELERRRCRKIFNDPNGRYMTVGPGLGLASAKKRRKTKSRGNK